MSNSAVAENLAEQDIVHERELDKGFIEEVAEQSGGEKIRECIQCGVCSATCPLGEYMDHTPREIINLTRAGFKDEVLSSNTPWICASCYSCLVDCPQEIEVSEIMYILKRMSIKENYATDVDSYTPGLLNSFVKEVKMNGRISEPYLIMGFKLRRSDFPLEKLMPIGLSLLKTDRLNMKIESMEKTEDIKKILNSLESES